MSWDAYLFGDLRWPMPDPGLVAVWRAMAIDPSRWSDWDGFVDGVGTGTIAALVDGGGPGDAPFQLAIDEHGARLRACVGDAHEELWQRLAIAWRLAADLEARGELVWVAGDAARTSVAYRAVISDGDSRWEKLTGSAATAIAALPGRHEVDAMAREHGARQAPVRAPTAPIPAAKVAAKARPAKKAPAKKAPAKKAPARAKKKR